MTSSPIAVGGGGILSSSLLAIGADGGGASASSSSINETNYALQLQTNHSGVSFILILDGCVFVLGLLILFCCLRNLRLWKRKKSSSSNNNFNINNTNNNIGSGNTNINDDKNERNVFKRFFKRIYQFLIFESEYERIGKLYGHEVSVYLWYSHQMILFTGLFTLIGLSVLLPLHLTGQISNSNTMNNLNVISKNQNSTNIETDSFLYKTSVNMVLSLTDRLYAHVILFYLFSILIFYLMYRFVNSKFVNQYINMDGFENDSNSTLNMISNYSVLLKDIPIQITDNTKFRKSVESIFPNLNIYSCRLIHDTSERIELQESFENSIEQIKHYEYVQNQTNKHVKLIKLFESSKKGKCCSKIIERVDALNYWNEKKVKLEHLIMEWEETFKNQPKSTGYGHVIFKSIQDASKCKAMDETGLKLFKLNNNMMNDNTTPTTNILLLLVSMIQMIQMI
ncbi:predicted protein [Naegleria gruberi]|uniref:Predicted protein n=1 Tax=Naegleria gruberi TaxID=5762 RepID=D2VSE2_NAEGR|nr:uncharacterized protein NAEGRDRAFT_71909 [Naegleria gruberi]EFC40404.1 predicted protein [Naegleria gruberi]|eukprot:XP_002673148.1 predicted protein [Naegleria gruberi strain NEG-M]